MEIYVALFVGFAICLVLTLSSARKREVASGDQRETLGRKREELAEELRRIAQVHFSVVSDIVVDRVGRTKQSSFTIDVPNGTIRCAISGRGISVVVPQGLIESKFTYVSMKGAGCLIVQEIEKEVFKPIKLRLTASSTLAA